jgi:hypothetical protein
MIKGDGGEYDCRFLISIIEKVPRHIVSSTPEALKVMDIDSKTESEFQYDGRIGPSQVEDIARDLRVLVREANEKAELSVE